MKIVHSALNVLSEGTKNFSDHAAAVSILAAMAGWLPALAAIASIVWYVVRLIDWHERRKLRNQLVAQGHIAEALGVKAGSDA